MASASVMSNSRRMVVEAFEGTIAHVPQAEAQRHAARHLTPKKCQQSGGPQRWFVSGWRQAGERRHGKEDDDTDSVVEERFSSDLRFEIARGPQLLEKPHDGDRIGW